MIDAIVREIHLRHEFLEKPHLESIYFGGGTPSLMDVEDIKKITLALSQYFTWHSDAEITLEANPDDLNSDKIQALYDLGVNRLSIGIQSFYQEDLAYMNRAHTAEEALHVLEAVQQVGFPTYTIDLIYGTPTLSDEQWQATIDKVIEMGVPHISAYALTVEERTALHHFISSGKRKPVEEEKARQQFIMLMDRLENGGYQHYEISNFSLPEHRAVHNYNYWMGKAYLGIGPAAHSYDGKNIRLWNIAHNANYMKGIEELNPQYESEILTAQDTYNEYILTRLRTDRGIEIADLLSMGHDYQEYFQKSVVPHIKSGNIKVIDENNYILTRQGKLMADHIASNLFYVDSE